MNTFGKDSDVGGKQRHDQHESVLLGTEEEMKPLKNLDQYPGMVLTTEKVGGGKGHDSNGNLNGSSSLLNGKSGPCKDFDEILEIIGSAGKFQKILLYAILCPIVALSPLLVQNTVFLWDTPAHVCHVPGRDPNMTLDEWRNLTLPWEMGPDGLLRYSQCKMIDQITGNETKCQFGWEYDKTDYDSTIPSEFNWVCDRDHYATECFSWTSFGSAIGTVIFGILADKWGRKLVFFMACFTILVFKTVSLFYAHIFLLYKTLNLLGNTAFPVIFMMPSMITAEASGASYRSWIYSVTYMVWVVGNSLLPFVAMICRRWFLFGCIAALPGVILLLYFPFLKESPRWLISVGKTERAIEIILYIAKTNGKSVDPGTIKCMVQDLVKKIKKDNEKQKVGMWTLFSKFTIAKNTIMLTAAWTINMLLYYGLTLQSMLMAGNKFINYFLLSVIQLPGAWLGGRLVEKTGRRWTETAFFLLCTLSCLLCAIVVAYPGYDIIVIIGALGIKFGVTVTDLVAFLQGTEIFPTQLRSTGSGLASTLANIIGTVGPYIIYSGTIHVSFPYALLCFCSFIGMVSASCLPETFKQHLPETIEDANKFGKGHKFWSYLPEEKEERQQRKLSKRNSSLK